MILQGWRKEWICIGMIIVIVGRYVYSACSWQVLQKRCSVISQVRRNKVDRCWRRLKNYFTSIRKWKTNICIGIFIVLVGGCVFICYWQVLGKRWWRKKWKSALVWIYVLLVGRYVCTYPWQVLEQLKEWKNKHLYWYDYRL